MTCFQMTLYEVQAVGGWGVLLKVQIPWLMPGDVAQGWSI